MISLAVFRFTHLDMTVARLFYHPGEASGSWPLGEAPLWRFFYKSSPLLTGILVFTGIILMIPFRRKGADRLRKRQGAFILLTVFLGPGLLINALLKDHWGRPRPRQVTAFAGTMEHRPLLIPGDNKKGKSFPCGHCSVGFSYLVFYFLWKDRYRRRARLAAAGAVILGILMGIGRMAAGAHFLSDVIWSGILTTAVVMLSYYGLLNIPRITGKRISASSPVLRRKSRFRKILETGLPLLIALFFVVALLFSFPHQRSLDCRQARSPLLRGIDIQVMEGELTLVLDPGFKDSLSLRGRVRGFGFPWNRLEEEIRHPRENHPRFRYRFQARGPFFELESRVMIRINPTGLRHITVHTGRGDIRVFRHEEVASPPLLELSSGEGNIIDLKENPLAPEGKTIPVPR